MDSGRFYAYTLVQLPSSIQLLRRVPSGPINNLKQTFEHPQALAREVTVVVDVSIDFVVDRSLLK
jgi:hypothetical protein